MLVTWRRLHYTLNQSYSLPPCASSFSSRVGWPVTYVHLHTYLHSRFIFSHAPRTDESRGFAAHQDWPGPTGSLQNRHSLAINRIGSQNPVHDDDENNNNIATTIAKMPHSLIHLRPSPLWRRQMLVQQSSRVEVLFYWIFSGAPVVMVRLILL